MVILSDSLLFLLLFGKIQILFYWSMYLVKDPVIFLLVAYNLHHVVSTITPKWEQKMEDGAHKLFLCTRTRSGIGHFCPHHPNPSVRHLRNVFELLVRKKRRKGTLCDHFTLSSTWRIYSSSLQGRQPKVPSSQCILSPKYPRNVLSSPIHDYLVSPKMESYEWKTSLSSRPLPNTQTHI